MAMPFLSPSRLKKILLGSSIILFFLLFLGITHTSLNFEAYGAGRLTTSRESILHPNSPALPNPWERANGTHPPRVNETYDARIPNIVNLVYLLPSGVHDFNFPFKDVLAVYSAWLYSDPDVIYFHTNAPASAIDRARSGRRGKWNSIILNAPQLVVKHVESPSHASNGIEITRMEHKSDFVRVAALEEYGGIYIDMDAIPLRDLRPLLETGFNTVLGRQLNGEIMSGNFIGKAGCEFFSRWRVEMHEVYDNQAWVTHSNVAMTRIAKRLARIDREVLVMESPAMGPIHWRGKATQAFYGVHDDVRSNLKGLSDGAILRDFTEGVEDRWDEAKRKSFPKWQNDYSDTYILHSWHEERGLRLPKSFDRVTPGYLLDRRSDFARAVYPIAKHMYEQGFIAFDDPWKYTVMER